MRAIVLLLGIAAIDLACAPGAAKHGPAPAAQNDDESDALYADDAFPKFAFTLPQSSLDALAVSPREYAPATLTIDGDDVGDVEIHVKGEDNFEPLPGKAALKVKLKHKYKGLSHFTLNNLLEDPSCLSERLAYAAYRELGSPAPRANNATVSINGDDYGVYANVETEDKHFLKRWFDDDGGNLYEEGGADFVPGSEHDFDKETNEDADDWSDLEGLTAAVAAAGTDTFLDDISGVVDVDAFLQYSALEAIVEQWDGYSYTLFGPNNFRLYFDPSTHKAHLIPWGLDMTFKPYEDHDLDVHAAKGLLLQRCLASTSCADRYDGVLRDTADAFAGLDLAGRAQTFHEQIGEGDIGAVLTTLQHRADDVKAAVTP